jgi:hypothetical protein
MLLLHVSVVKPSSLGGMTTKTSRGDTDTNI